MNTASYFKMTAVNFQKWVFSGTVGCEPNWDGSGEVVCGMRTGKAPEQCNVDTLCVEILGSSSSLRLIMLNLRMHNNMENLSKGQEKEKAF